MNSLLKVVILYSLVAMVTTIFSWENFTIYQFGLLVGTFFAIMAVFMHEEIIIPKNWPVKAQVYEKRFGGYLLRDTRAKRVLDKEGSYQYQIRGDKTPIPVFKYEDIVNIKTKEGRGSKDLLMLYSPAPGQYHPMKLNVDEDTIKVIPQNILDWILLLPRKAMYVIKSKESALIKYFPIIAVGIFLIFYAIFMIMMWQGVFEPTLRYGQELVPQVGNLLPSQTATPPPY